MATAGFVFPFMPYYAGERPVIAGIGREMIARAGSANPTLQSQPHNRTGFRTLSASIWKGLKQIWLGHVPGSRGCAKAAHLDQRRHAGMTTGNRHRHAQQNRA